MKQYWIVMTLILVILCGAYLVQEIIHRQIEDFSLQFEQLEELCAAEDATAKEQSHRLVQQWDRKREFWEIFIDHACLDEAQVTVYEIHGGIQYDAPLYAVRTAFSKLEADLEQIDMQTRLTVGHLF